MLTEEIKALTYTDPGNKSQSVVSSGYLPAAIATGKPLADYSPNWFAVFTTACHEKRIAWHFEQRQVESFLPLYSVTRRWKNRRTVQLEVPLFPSYIFVRIDRRERVRVLEVPGVLGVVGIKRDLAEIPDLYIDGLREGICRHKIEPHPYLVVGERVRIIRGPMLGCEGILLRKKNDLRVILTLDMIMRSVAIEVDADHLEPVKSNGPWSVAGGRC